MFGYKKQKTPPTMKNIKTLLGGIKQMPEFEKLTTYQLIQKLINSLPFGLKRGVKFAYLKNNIITFALLHPLYKKEFLFAENTIKALITNLNFETEIKGISFFILNEVTFKEKKEVEKTYKEKSFGIFTNNVKDKKLNALFEKIRENILENRFTQQED